MANETTGNGTPAPSKDPGARIANLLSDTGGNADPLNGEKPSDKPKKPKSKAAPAKQETAPQNQTGENPEEELADGDTGEGEATDNAEGDETATGDEGDESQSDEDQDQDADGADDETDGDEDDGTEYEVKVNGKTEKVTLKELKNGYSRTADYTRKSVALANERKEVEAIKASVKDLPVVQKQYQDSAQKFGTNAALVLKALETRFMPAEPSEELRTTNPGEYIRQKELRQEAFQFARGLGVELQGIEKQAVAEHTKRVQEGRVKLMEVRPELKDPTNRQKLVTYAQQFGFTPEAIANEASPHIFNWAWKAMQYDEIMKRKSEITPEKSKPKVLKQTKSVPGHKAVADRERTAIIDNHRKNKSINSAAAALDKVLR